MSGDSTVRVRLHRLRQLGYKGAPCPEGTSKEECQAWAEGVWKRQAEMTPAPKHKPVVAFPFNGSKA